MQLGTIRGEKIQFPSWPVSPTQTCQYDDLGEICKRNITQGLQKIQLRAEVGFICSLGTDAKCSNNRCTWFHCSTLSYKNFQAQNVSNQVFNSAQLGGESDYRVFPEMNEINKSMLGIRPQQTQVYELLTSGATKLAV